MEITFEKYYVIEKHNENRENLAEKDIHTIMTVKLVNKILVK